MAGRLITTSEKSYTPWNPAVRLRVERDIESARVNEEKKKQDDESVASATSLDSAATPDTLSREIAEMTKDIASTPLTKEKKKEKRGWFSSGKKNPKKKVRTCEEIIIYVASQQLTQPSIRFTHSRRRPKAKKRGQKRSQR